MRKLSVLLLLLAVQGLALAGNGFHKALTSRSDAGLASASISNPELELRALFTRPTAATGGPAAVQSGSNASLLPVLASAAVPGSGQMLQGKWIKGLVFVAAEAALWFGYRHWDQEGKDLEQEFRVYADEHWSFEDWNANYNEATDPSTHHLPGWEPGDPADAVIKTQQYYEMIGKYDQFMKGWDDWYEGGPDLTDHRYAYETMRNESNKASKKGSYCAMAIVANHLISTFDAMITYKHLTAQARMAVATTPYIQEPVLTSGVSLSW